VEVFYSALQFCNFDEVLKFWNNRRPRIENREMSEAEIFTFHFIFHFTTFQHSNIPFSFPTFHFPFSIFFFAANSQSHSLTVSLTHSLTHSLTVTLPTHNLTHCHSLSLTVTHCHSLSSLLSKLTHFHSLSLTFTHSLTADDGHSLPPSLTLISTAYSYL